MLVVESSDVGKVMERIFHNHMVHCFKVKPYVGG